MTVLHKNQGNEIYKLKEKTFQDFKKNY